MWQNYKVEEGFPNHVRFYRSRKYAIAFSSHRDLRSLTFEANCIQWTSTSEPAFLNWMQWASLLKEAHHLKKVNTNVALTCWALFAQFRSRGAQERQEFQGWDKDSGHWLNVSSHFTSGSQVPMNTQGPELDGCHVFYLGSLSTSTEGFVAMLPFQPEHSCIPSNRNW